MVGKIASYTFVLCSDYSHCITAPAIVPPGNETETECEEDDFRYFQIECPAFSDTVIIEVIDIVGHCAVYVSTMIVNPGPLNPVAETVRNENANVNRRRVIIRISTSRVRHEFILIATIYSVLLVDVQLSFVPQ